MNYKTTIFLTLIILLAGMTAAIPSYGQSREELEKELNETNKEIKIQYKLLDMVEKWKSGGLNVGFNGQVDGRDVRMKDAASFHKGFIDQLYKEKAEIERKLGLLRSNKENTAATLRNSKTHQMIESYDHGQAYQNLVNAASAEDRAYEALSGGYRNMGNNLSEERQQSSRNPQSRVNALDIISLNLADEIAESGNEYSPTADYNSLPHISDEVAKGFYMGDDIPIPYEKRDSVIRAYFKNQRAMDSIMLAKAALEDSRMEPFRKRLDKLSDADLESWIANYTEYSTMSALAGNCYLSPENSCPDGWQKVEEKSLRKVIDDMNDNNCGYHCDFYINEEGKYVLAFAGTDDIIDVLFNWIPGAISKSQGTISDELLQKIVDEYQKIVSGQTSKALETVKNIMGKLGPDAKDKLVLAGHSLGGRLASEAAIEYGLPAFTFNTAGISMETRKETKMNLDKADNAGRIINITTSNDILTNIQGYPLGKVYECLKIVYSTVDAAAPDLKTFWEIIKGDLKGVLGKIKGVSGKYKEAFENLYVYNSTDIGMIGAHIELDESYSGHSIVGLNKSIEYRLEYIKKYLADRRSKRKFYQSHA